MSGLLPCPFCGGGETRIRENRHSPTMSGNAGLISVEITHWCPAAPGQPSRNTVTRTGRDHASAIAAWNRRAPSADARAAEATMRERVVAWHIEQLEGERALADLAEQSGDVESWRLHRHIMAQHEQAAAAIRALPLTTGDET